MTKLPARIEDMGKVVAVEKATSGIDVLLQQIRPEWRTKKLLKRVKLLLDVDPSSACQKMFNAAVHDLRQKLIIAGTLRDCIEDSFEDSFEENEVRFLRIQKLIERLRDESNQRWRDKVTDVRRWFDFVANVIDQMSLERVSSYDDSTAIDKFRRDRSHCGVRE